MQLYFEAVCGCTNLLFVVNIKEFNNSGSSLDQIIQLILYIFCQVNLAYMFNLHKYNENSLQNHYISFTL